jgi:two-component system, NarL family, invasion response regulator UvrY
MEVQIKNVLLIEDHPLIRLSLRTVFAEIDSSIQLYEAENFTSAGLQIQGQKFDLVVLDIHIPGGKGLEMVDLLRQAQAGVLILVYSGADESQFALPYISAGADGYVSKSSEKQEIIEAVRTLMQRKKYMSAKLHGFVLQNGFDSRSIHQVLSEREYLVMQMMLDGKWANEIAAELGIQANTVSTFKARIFRKLNVTSVIELYEKVNSVFK